MEKGSAPTLEKVAGNQDKRTEYLYDGQMPVIDREYNSSNQLTLTRVNLPGAQGVEGVISVPASDSTSLNWLMVDGHGNVIRTIAENFAASLYQWLEVWGERQTGTLQTGKGYCANLVHIEDDTGLVYMRARYYEPAIGRFISEDPARDGVNWYLYAHGNPVNKVDVDGTLSREEFIQWFSALLATRIVWESFKPFVGKPIQLLGYFLLSVANNLIKDGCGNLAAGLIELRMAGVGGIALQALGLGLSGGTKSLLGASETALGIALKSVAIYLIGVGEGMLPDIFR